MSSSLNIRFHLEIENKNLNSDTDNSNYSSTRTFQSTTKSIDVRNCINVKISYNYLIVI